MKGIILAGGSGSRLYPLTLGVSKQLLPVYDKPMIYYPLSVLMFSYAEQPRPEGLAQAFIIGRSFIGSGPVCLILGDNIFYGQGLSGILQRAVRLTKGGLIFGYLVRDPERYGVVEFNADGVVTGIVEKPRQPRSHYAVPGLYFYDNDVVDIARDLKPSMRGELEITDVNLAYLKRGNLRVELLGRGFAWLDTGTHEALQQAASYVQAIQERQGLKISCVEEIAFRMGYINSEQIRSLATRYTRNDYGRYLVDIADEKDGIDLSF